MSSKRDARRIVRGLVLTMTASIAVTASNATVAQANFADPAYIKRLPQYCQDRRDPERWKRWREYLGPVYIHIHHYCSGIYTELKAKETLDKRKLDELAGQTAHQMAYVSPYCDPTCVIYADLHRRWAWALSVQGNSVEARKHIEMMKAARPTGVRPPANPAVPR